VSSVAFAEAVALSLFGLRRVEAKDFPKDKPRSGGIKQSDVP